MEIMDLFSVIYSQRRNKLPKQSAEFLNVNKCGRLNKHWALQS